VTGSNDKYVQAGKQPLEFEAESKQVSTTRCAVTEQCAANENEGSHRIEPEPSKQHSPVFKVSQHTPSRAGRIAKAQ
jgi:hypothetical protein